MPQPMRRRPEAVSTKGREPDDDKTFRDRLERLDDPLERAAERTANRWFKPGQSHNLLIRTSWKLIVFVVGATFALVGLALLVLPGPGIPVLILGLAILASEFAWARFLLQEARKHAAKAGMKVRRLRRSKRKPTSDI